MHAYIDYTDLLVLEENCTYELEVVAALSKLQEFLSFIFLFHHTDEQSYVRPFQCEQNGKQNRFYSVSS